MQIIKAEYVWVDGTKPDPLLRKEDLNDND